MLLRYGIILRKGWIVSPALVDACSQRLGIEDYFRASVGGEVGPSQREFARRNPALLAHVLKRVWPELGHSPSVHDDGSFNQEKWGILKYAGLPATDLADLLRQSLASDGLSGGLVEFVLAGPIHGIDGDIEQIMLREENAVTRRDATSITQIYGLALLYSLGAKGIPERLARVSRSERATQVEKDVISSIRAKIRAKKRILWPDLEILES